MLFKENLGALLSRCKSAAPGMTSGAPCARPALLTQAPVLPPSGSHAVPSLALTQPGGERSWETHPAPSSPAKTWVAGQRAVCFFSGCLHISRIKVLAEPPCECQPLLSVKGRSFPSLPQQLLARRELCCCWKLDQAALKAFHSSSVDA